GGTTHTDPDGYLKQFGITIEQFKEDIERMPKTEKLYPSLDSPYLYQVKKGDTLWNLAQTNGLSVNDLMKENNLHSSHLSVGQILKIPFIRQHALQYKEWVKEIQRRVGVPADGSFGPLTLKAVIQYLQKNIGAHPTGLWDTQTALLLKSIRFGM